MFYPFNFLIYNTNMKHNFDLKMQKKNLLCFFVLKYNFVNPKM